MGAAVEGYPNEDYVGGSFEWRVRLRVDRIDTAVKGRPNRGNAQSSFNSR